MSGDVRRVLASCVAAFLLMAADAVEVPPDVLGPLGLTVASIAVVVYLGREHFKRDADLIADLRAQRDRATAGWEAQTAATNRLADALETQARDGASRRRQTDR